MCVSILLYVVINCVYGYRGDGERLYYPNDSPTVKGIYNNDPHTLIRFDTMASDDEKYTLVLSQINKKRDTYFTISVFSSCCPFRFNPTPGIPAHKIELSGAWTQLTCGGTSRHNSFYRNPQYRYVLCLSNVLLICPQYIHLSACL